MTTEEHVHAHALRWIAGGEPVQVLAGGWWRDIPGDAALRLIGAGRLPPGGIRMRPKTVSGRYRVALMRGREGAFVEVAGSEPMARRLGALSSFVCWLTDWVEYEYEAEACCRSLRRSSNDEHEAV